MHETINRNENAYSYSILTQLYKVRAFARVTRDPVLLSSYQKAAQSQKHPKGNPLLFDRSLVDSHDLSAAIQRKRLWLSPRDTRLGLSSGYIELLILLEDLVNCKAMAWLRVYQLSSLSSVTDEWMQEERLFMAYSRMAITLEFKGRQSILDLGERQQVDRIRDELHSTRYLLLLFLSLFEHPHKNSYQNDLPRARLSWLRLTSSMHQCFETEFLHAIDDIEDVHFKSGALTTSRQVLWELLSPTLFASQAHSSVRSVLAAISILCSFSEYQFREVRAKFVHDVLLEQASLLDSRFSDPASLISTHVLIYATLNSSSPSIPNMVQTCLGLISTKAVSFQPWYSIDRALRIWLQQGFRILHQFDIDGFRGYLVSESIAIVLWLLLTFLGDESASWNDLLTRMDSVFGLLDAAQEKKVAQTWRSMLDGLLHDCVCRTFSQSCSIYRPFSREREIRLLSLTRTSSGAQGSFVYATLYNAPAYEALSYTWGSSLRINQFQLEGHSVPITRNLSYALDALTPESGSRLSWIDAICIHQEDIGERNRQVGLMRDIYRSAKCTLVWLGKAAHGSDMAMQFLQRLEVFTEVKYRNRLILQSFLNSDSFRSLYQALNHLYSERDYWRRLWIIQEVLCAQEVQVICGDYTVSYAIIDELPDLLRDAIKVFAKDERRAAATHFMEDLCDVASFVPERLPLSEDHVLRQPLLSLLLDYSTSFCTDGRDKIFGLLGISAHDGSDHQGLTIDYSKPAPEVFRNAARAIIELSGELHCICLAWDAFFDEGSDLPYTQRLSDLPSWVPSFDTQPLVEPIKTSIPNERIYRACGESQADVQFSEHGTVLIACGIELAAVKHCSPPGERWVLSDESDPWPEVEEYLHSLMSLREFMYDRLSLPLGDISTSTMKYWDKVLHSALLPFNRREQSPEEIQEMISMTDWWRDWQESPTLAGGYTRSAYEKKDYLSRIPLVLENKTLFISEAISSMMLNRMLVGSGPSKSRPGDIICILFGCSIPIILRPELDHYVFIGEACVPTHMRGEAMEELDRGFHLKKRFIIH